MKIHPRPASFDSSLHAASVKHRIESALISGKEYGLMRFSGKDGRNWAYFHSHAWAIACEITSLADIYFWSNIFLFLHVHSVQRIQGSSGSLPIPIGGRFTRSFETSTPCFTLKIRFGWKRTLNGAASHTLVAKGQWKKRWRLDSSCPQCVHLASMLIPRFLRFSPTGKTFRKVFLRKNFIFGAHLIFLIYLLQLNSTGESLCCSEDYSSIIAAWYPEFALYSPDLVSSHTYLSGVPFTLGLIARISFSCAGSIWKGCL